MHSTIGTQAVSEVVEETLPLAFFKARMGNRHLESKRHPSGQPPPPVHGLQRAWSCRGCARFRMGRDGRAGVLPRVCGGWCS